MFITIVKSDFLFDGSFCGPGRFPHRVCKFLSLQWRNNECSGVSNHRHLDSLLNRLSRRRSKKTSKLRVTGLCEGNSTVIGEFPAQRASNAENVSFGWRHRDTGDNVFKENTILIVVWRDIIYSKSLKLTLTYWCRFKSNFNYKNRPLLNKNSISQACNFRLIHLKGI